MQAIGGSWKTLQSGLPLAAPAPAAAPRPAARRPHGLEARRVGGEVPLLWKVKPGTVKSYRTAADELAAFLGNPRITRITGSDITRFQEHLAKRQ